MRKHILYLIVFFGSLSSCHVPYGNITSGSSYYEPGAPAYTSADSGIILLINPYQKELNKVMSEVLAHSGTIMEKGKPESKLGNFVADACMDIAVKKYKNISGNTIDFCLLNNGGLRSSLPSGDITRKNVFELMPFENELVVLTVSGSSMLKVLKYISDAGGVPVSNLRMKISGNSFSDVLIGEQPFNAAATYRVATSDYLANGGDAMEMFSEKLLLERLDIKVRDAIIDFMTTKNNLNENLNPELDGRISN